MTSRLIYIVACAGISLVLKTELHYFVYVPHLDYLFIHQWTLGLLLPFALVVNAAMNMTVPISVPVPAFSLFGIYPHVKLIIH